MKISDAGFNMIREFEGLRVAAYRCPAGIWTIGYGHTGPDVYRGLRITPERACRLLEQDIVRFECGVDDLLGNAPTTQGQFDALVSFAFNCGLGALRGSTLLKLHRAGKYRLAAAAFMLWIRGGGRKLPGLVRRRNAERRLYSS